MHESRTGPGNVSVWLLALVLAGQGVPAPAAERAVETRPKVMRGAEVVGPVTPHRFLGDVRDLPKATPWRPGDPLIEIPLRQSPVLDLPGDPANATTWTRDPLLDLQDKVTAQFAPRTVDPPELNVAGQSYTGVVPPDTVGDIGATHYIQAVNASSGATFAIYDRNDGSLVAGPTHIDALGAGGCTSGGGDPIVLYDEAADRWLLMEFASGNRICVYLSLTADPVAGGWLNYEFQTAIFPDYPKIAVWPDAYYVSTNEQSGGAHPALYGLDRASMLAGAPATFQRMEIPRLLAFGFQALLPADLDGPTPPPPGSPAYYIRHRDDEGHNPGANDPDRDFLEIWEFHVDFANPSNTTLVGPRNVEVTEFDSSLCSFNSTSCIPHPGGAPLAALQQVVMWRLQYRNFGTHETLVGNLVTDVDGTNHAGVRWFELRQTEAEPWTVFQEGTLAPNVQHRWMGSAAMDAGGNIAVGYTVSGTIFPSLYYSGRGIGDPLGTLPVGEVLLAAGRASQGTNRWGDYSSMNVDPVDDCAFWYTGEYLLAPGQWATRIGRFEFDACGLPGFILNGSRRNQEVCPPGGFGLTVDVGSVQGFGDPVTLSYVGLPPGFGGSFTTNPVLAPGASEASVTAAPGVAAGEYEFTIRAEAAGLDDQEMTIDVVAYDQTPAQVILDAPADASMVDSVTPTFTWDAVAQATGYVIEIALDPGFASVVETGGASLASYESSGLAPGTQYYWRVRAANACGPGLDSSTWSFTTSSTICRSPGLAIPDDDPAGLTDALSVTPSGEISDLDVTLNISHTYVGHLTVTLEHQQTGTVVTLLDRPGFPAQVFGCRQDDIDAILDDEASDPVENECALAVPTIDGSFIPEGPLSAFDGESLGGTWVLKIVDAMSAETGTLNSWCIGPVAVSPSAGRVPDGNQLPGASLLVDKATGGAVTLTWDLSCSVDDLDYAIYEGSIGSFTSHTALHCSTGGETSETFVPGGGDRYYVVVPRNVMAEGSYGADGDGFERSPGLTVCLPQSSGCR